MRACMRLKFKIATVITATHRRNICSCYEFMFQWALHNIGIPRNMCSFYTSKQQQQRTDTHIIYIDSMNVYQFFFRFLNINFKVLVLHCSLGSNRTLHCKLKTSEHFRHVI